MKSEVKPSAEQINRNRTTGFWASWGFPIAWLVALCIVVPVEMTRWNQRPPEMRNIASWFIAMDPDTSLAGLFLLIAPLLWSIRGGIQIGRSDPLTSLLAWGGLGISGNGDPKVSWKLRFCAIGLSLLSMLVNFGVGRNLQQLPPAYHDEYSYLFQAKTYLDGKISYPVHPAGEVFDQIHVLNQGRFTSRYFPGTGMWLAPFVALGDPHLGHVIAGGLITWWIFWVGFEVGGTTIAIIAGLLTACSPGMAIFGNLLLAHHPGLAGLSLFLYRFLRWMRTEKLSNLWLAGFGLSYAMLCRPMTAAGFALHFGIFFASWLFRRFQIDRKRFFSGLLALGIPLLVGFAVLGYWNLHTTGNWRMTAYQAYNDDYTPRHVYGFNNVVRGEQALGDRVLPIATRNYDTWAENLTPKLAAINVYQRWVASWRWTLGIIPLLLVTLSAIPFLTGSSVKWRLIALSILSLHVVHIPYWFDGIMHWHYVFETVVLWPLLFAGGTAVLFEHWRKESRPWMGLWWIGLAGVILATSFIPLEPYWGSRVAGAESELLFAKVRYARFRQILQQQVHSRPALVLIEHDPADRSLDYVNNDPRLESEILLGRFDPQKTDSHKLRELFPQRTLYLYHVKQNQLEMLQ